MFERKEIKYKGICKAKIPFCVMKNYLIIYPVRIITETNYNTPGVICNYRQKIHTIISMVTAHITF